MHYCGIFYVCCWKIRVEKRDTIIINMPAEQWRYLYTKVFPDPQLRITNRINANAQNSKNIR